MIEVEDDIHRLLMLFRSLVSVDVRLRPTETGGCLRNGIIVSNTLCVNMTHSV